MTTVPGYHSSSTSTWPTSSVFLPYGPASYLLTQQCILYRTTVGSVGVRVLGLYIGLDYVSRPGHVSLVPRAAHISRLSFLGESSSCRCQPLTQPGCQAESETEEQVAGTEVQRGACARREAASSMQSKAAGCGAIPRGSMTVWALVITFPGSSPAQHALLIRQSSWGRTGRQTHKHRRRDTRQRSGSRSPAQPSPKPTLTAWTA